MTYSTLYFQKRLHKFSALNFHKACISLCYIFLSIHTYANQPQNPDTIIVDSTFYVRILNDSAIPTDTVDGIILTGDTALNNLFIQYNVTECRRPFLGARGEFLKKAYQITCDNCNIDSLMGYMDSEFEHFSDFHRLDYIEDTTSLSSYNPADDFWSQTTETDYLWHLKNIEADKAWNITTGDPNIIIAFIDRAFDYYHPDLLGEIINQTDPIQQISLTNCSIAMSENHGTSVANFASGQTTLENGTPPSGSKSSSVGFNTKMFGYVVGNSYQSAWDASFVQKADIVFTCAQLGAYSCPDDNEYAEEITKEILDNGTVIVVPAGNNDLQNTSCPQIAPVIPFNRFSPIYDDRVICVSASTMDDKHYFEENQIDKTHAHHPWVDLCAPGYELTGAISTQCGTNQFPYRINHESGTSFSAPITAGAASLVKSVNPCLPPNAVKEILKTTTDPLIDAHLFPNGVGTERLNVYQAVLMAQNYNSTFNDFYGNVTISGKEYVSDDIIVHPGAHLTVTGEISFSSNASLIVMPNAKLTIDGGTLMASRGCQTDFWGGIKTQVDGGAQLWAEVEIKNNATVEGALTGIRAWDPNATLYPLITSQIHVTNSTFLNCRKAIDIQSHLLAAYLGNSPTEPFIVANNFEIDEHYPDLSQHPLQQILLVNVNGARIQSNTFSNKTSSLGTFPSTERGVGIFSQGSFFRAKSNTFTNLYTGIEHHYYNFNGIANIISNTFKSCNYGIRSHHNSTSIIKHNNFDANLNSGVYIQAAQDFELNNNTFQNHHNYFSTGLQFENSGINPSLFDENYFNSNYNSVYFVGNNEELTYSCNKWDNSIGYDIVVAASSLINNHQGTIGKPVVNYYSPQPCPQSYTHFDNSMGATSVQFCPPKYSPPRAIPSCMPMINNTHENHPQLKIVYSEDWCEPDGIGLITGFYPSDSPETAETLIIQGRIKIENEDDHIQALKDIIDDEYDGGDTDYLTDLIHDVTIDEEDLTSILLDFSPKLSHNVLHECIHRSPALSADNLFNILYHNSPLPYQTFQDSTIIYENLQESLYDSLSNLQTGMSHIDSINLAINDHQFKFDINLRNQLIRFLNDSNLTHGSDSAFVYLKRYRFDESYLLPLLKASWNNLNFDLAQEILDTISLSVNLEPFHSTLQTIHNSCYIDSLSLYHTYHDNESFRNTLNSFVEHENRMLSSFAQGIITFTNDTIFQYETIPIPTGSGKKDPNNNLTKEENTNPSKNSMDTEEKIKIFPNPANDKLNVTLSTESSIISFKIINVAGIEIQSGTLNNLTTIDVSKLTPGLYFILIDTKKKTNTFKFVKK